MEHKEIAKTIQQQIMAIGKPIVWSWGAHNYYAVDTKNLKSDFNIDGMAALKFCVNGAKFKGFVIVVLNYIDTYDVYFGNYDGSAFVVENTLENVYCDELGYQIDEFVEKLPTYRY